MQGIPSYHSVWWVSQQKDWSDGLEKSSFSMEETGSKDLNWLSFMHKYTFFKDVHYNYIFAYSQLGKKLWTSHSKDIWWFFMECDSKAIHSDVGSGC